MSIDPLAPPERAFVEWLGEALARSPAAALDLLLQAPEDPTLITTSIVDGRFKSLSLRAIGPRLRWERPIGSLTLPLDGLEMTELDVHGLDLTALWIGPGVERLDCGANALQQLDLSRATNLAVLDASANDLMVLDLREHRAIRFVDCTGNALSALILADDAPVKVIRAARNQLMVFDIGHRPHLTELRLDRNALVHLRLNTPELRVLSVHRNQLTRLDLEGLGKLQSLDVSRNRLATLDTQHTPLLRALHCSHNYLDELATTGLDYLEELQVRDNQLQRLAFGPSNALYRLVASENRLVSIDLRSCPCLEFLDVSGNHLERLDLGGVPSLTSLRATGNALTSFELAPTPHLARLHLDQNPLERVDLAGSTSLTRVRLTGTPEVQAPPALVRQLPALRRATGLPVHDAVADMDRFELHHLAATYRGPDRESVLLQIAQDTERCARGTALLIYWATHPHYYAQFASRDEVPPYAAAGWDLLEQVEALVRTDAYVHDDVPFDPRADRTHDPRGKDWTQSGTAGPGRRAVPAFMTRASS